MDKAGIFVSRYRMEQAPFHSTIATYGPEYDFAEGFKKVNEAVPIFNPTAPVVIDHFFLRVGDRTFVSYASTL